MRRILVALLGLGMAVLSFDALRAYALTGHPLASGVIPVETILPRPWLAMLWAVMVDLAAAAGILGVKDDRGDWRAWLMLLLALAATLGFQVLSFPPVIARAVLIVPGAPALKLTSTLPVVTAKTVGTRISKAMSRIMSLPPIAPIRVAAPDVRLIA